MSHHYSGPDVGFPNGDARLDITDLFAFPKPGDPRRSILIVDAHPSCSSANPPERTTREPFNDKAIYELLIDTNDDDVADISYRLRVSPSPNGGGQTATLRRAEGAQAALMGDEGRVIAQAISISTGPVARPIEENDHRVFVGRRSDPFFFDLRGVKDLNFTGDDYFKDKDVHSLVLDVPNAALGSGPLGLWARVLLKTDGRWVQVERGGRPSQTPFLAGEGDDRAAYLAGEPKDDARFVGVFAHSLEEGPGKYAPEAARRVAHKMLPDILRYDPRVPASYPLSGRLLTDDVSDLFLPIFTNGKVTTDKVGPHRDLLPEFPYLGPPHEPG